jgi:hypothetical protein
MTCQALSARPYNVVADAIQYAKWIRTQQGEGLPLFVAGGSLGRAVLVDPRLIPGGPKVAPSFTLGGPQVERAWFQRLTLRYDGLLSNFAFNFNLRLYTSAAC